MLGENNCFAAHLQQNKTKPKKPHPHLPTTKQQSFHPFCIVTDWQDIVRIQLGIAAVKLLSFLVLPMLKTICMDLSES